MGDARCTTDLLELLKERVSAGVLSATICLLTGLRLHDLTAQTPFET